MPRPSGIALQIGTMVVGTGIATSQPSAFAVMARTTPAAPLSEDWRARTEQKLSFSRKLGDVYESGKPLWLTETADAACGGTPWSATFLDTFRYLDQLGRLAKQGVQVVMHNTLAASDDGLLPALAALWSRRPRSRF